MSELSRCLMVTNGNITGIVDQLERDGLVERNKANTDRRSSVIMLTPEGRQYFRRLSEAYRARVAELFSPMDNEAQNDLFALLAKLKEAIRPQCQAINEAPR